MATLLVLYYSSYGHHRADGRRRRRGRPRQRAPRSTSAALPETAPAAVVQAAGFKTDTAHPLLSDPNELANYDAIAVGTPTRFGRMSSQMASFRDTAGGVWAQGKLNGKVGAAFTSTGSQHGGQETTLFSVLTNLIHFRHGDRRARFMALPARWASTRSRAERPMARRRSPVPTVSRQPGEADLAGARYLGERVARTTREARRPESMRRLPAFASHGLRR